ncbi:MAG: hypothetical protein U0667_06080 [Chloroflexota bacterium]
MPSTSVLVSGSVIERVGTRSARTLGRAGGLPVIEGQGRTLDAWSIDAHRHAFMAAMPMPWR